MAGPNGSFVLTGACNSGVPGSNTVRVAYCHFGCVHTVLQTVQRHGVYTIVYGTVLHTGPLKPDIRVDFGFHSVAISP